MPSFGFYSEKKSYPLYYFFDPEFSLNYWQRPIYESKSVVSLDKINSLQAKRMWVIFSDWGRSGELDANSQSVKHWCDNKFKLEFAQELDGLWVYRYGKNES